MELDLGTSLEILSRKACPLCRFAIQAMGRDICLLEQNSLAIPKLRWKIYFKYGSSVLHPSTGSRQYPVYLYASCPLRRWQSPLFLPFAEKNGVKKSPKRQYGRHNATKVELTDLIRQWIRRCDQNHRPSCVPIARNSSSVKDLLVIDVWNDCLVVHPQNRGYVALSYVWGNHTCPGTRRESISLLKR
jgi:hypothetical protein